ncbi:hypothetical protein ALQ72_05165 [Pseudomonas syringae pv. maculicola]|uniref:hypothetical protein n=1 Tax=Pseudomonas syringae group genomosp. 3 TaxID=251701 RepID=UPI0006B9297C|nr:hypothetical protein [Pseudomonas syringae group genomosp. 3]MBM0212729.1 hypothetical protein [Pseudomonas syringae pv. maculicola]RMM71904.1 hypothetical protein ALQ72_05165 [Pseudomonas syringae pv. maculicola]
MKMPEWIILISLFCLAVVAVGTLVWLLKVVTDVVFVLRSRSEFLKNLKLSLKHSQPEWDKVCDIAKTHGLTKFHAYQVVEALVRDVRTGKEEDQGVTSRLDKLDSYIAAYRQNEPFEGLPSETNLSLERLRIALGNNSHLLHPLTDHIKDLHKIHNRTNHLQRFYTLGGFLVGIAGLVYGIYTSNSIAISPPSFETSINQPASGSKVIDVRTPVKTSE